MIDQRSALFAKLRRHVERIIAEEYTVSDLESTIRILRDHTHSVSVREVGHFLAHPARDAGAVTEWTRERVESWWVAVASNHASTQLRIPPGPMRRFLQAQLNTLRAQVSKGAGLKLQEARRALEAVLPLVEGTQGTRLIFSEPVDEQSERLIAFLCNNITTRPSFTGSDLLRDVTISLRDNGALSSKEVNRFARCGDRLSLVAIASMHDGSILLENDQPFDLYTTSPRYAWDEHPWPPRQAGQEPDLPTGLGVFLTLYVLAGREDEMATAVGVFMTDLDPQIWAPTFPQMQRSTHESVGPLQISPEWQLVTL